MAIVQISKIQHRTGANAELPQLSEGEIGFSTDERRVFIGNDPVLHPPANSNTTTQTELLTEVSSLSFRKIEGSANTGLVVNGQTLEDGQVLVTNSNVWVNGGGNAGGLINLGYVSNVRVLGGVNGYTLQTDGLGNLSWGASGVLAYDIANVSKADPAVVTTTTPSSVVTGVAVTIVGVDGMTELNTAGTNSTNRFYAVKISDTTFSLYTDALLATTVNSSSFTSAVADTGSVTISLYAAGNGNPGGANTQVQFNNDSGLFGGSPNFTFLKTTNTLTVGGNIVAANVNADTFGNHNGAVGTIAPDTGAFTSITVSSTALVDGNLTAGNFKSNGVANIIGNLTAGNIYTAGLANVVDLSVVGNVITNLQPDANSTLDLGSISQRWKDLYLSGNSIYIGNHTISTATTSVVFNSDITSVNANLGNLATANYFSGMLTSGNQPNITSVGTLGNLTVTGPVDLGEISNLHIAGGYPDYVLTTAGDGNVSWRPGTSSRTPAAGNNYNVQYSVGTVFTADDNFTYYPITSTLAVPTIQTDGGLISNIQASNIIGTVSSANTVTDNTQPNITSVGTLNSIQVNGNANIGGMITAGAITVGVADLKVLGGTNGQVLQTDGYGVLSWTAQTGGNGGSGTPGGSNTQIQFNDGGNFAGSSSLTFNNSTSTLTSVYLGGTLITNAQPNITSVGTLTGLEITGNTIAGNIAAGNLISANYFSGELTSGPQPNINSVGNLTAANVTGNLTAGNITGANLITANYFQGTLITNAQPNITSVGILNGLVVNGNLSATGKVSLGNVLNISIQGGSNDYVLKTDGLGNLSWTAQSGGGSATPAGINTEIQFNDANSFAGDANLTFNKSTGTLTATLMAGTLTTASQPNITSLGTLTSLDVTGNTTSGNIFANTGTVKGNLLTGTLTTSAQPNITSVGTLSNLTVQGNLSAANGNLGNLTTANYFEGTLITNAQPNITSVGTLGGLSINCSASEIDAVTLTGTYHSLYTSTDSYGITLVTGAGQTGTGLYFLPNDQMLGIVNNSNIGAVFTQNGHFAPYYDKTINLGDPTSKWKNAYLGDVHIENGIGNWTMVAGSDGLYLYDNINSTTYKISMTQVVSGAPNQLGF